MHFNKEFIDRFEDKFIPEPNSGCWLWFAGADQHGYGRVRVGSKKDGTRTTAIAPRVSWQIYRGDPAGFHVCHKCDVPACVNPDHLFLGTQTDNMRDCSAKGRTSRGAAHSAIQKAHQPKGKLHHLYGKPGRSGERNGASKLKVSEVIKIRKDKRTLLAIASDYGVSWSVIGQIKRRNTWKHVP